MKVKILCLFLIGLVAVCNAAPLNSNEQEARAFVQRASTKMFNYYDELSREIFEADNNDPAKVMSALETLVKTAKKVVEIVKESKQYDDSKFVDPELKYVFKIIRKSAEEAILGEEKFVELFASMGMLEELASDKDIPAYRNNSVELAFFPDIQDIFAKSQDPEELKYYWTTWRAKNGAWAIGHFVNLVKSLKEAAALTEITPLEFWLHDYNITEMRKVVKQIRPLYNQLHAFIRNRLYQRYGDLVIKPNGPIPHHLFEQVLAQAWTPGSIIDDMYPHKDLPPYDEILKQNDFDTLKMFKMADKFYQSLGFNSIPEEYWGSHFKMNSDEDEGDCKPTIFDMSPNVYMQYCQKMDFRKFLQAHGYMGEVYYAREKVDLPVYYFDAHYLQFPVGEAVVLSASTPKHLSAIGLVTDFKFTEEVKMNRLLRMGIHTLLNMPVYYIHTKVMYDLFAGTVDMTDLNKHYWKLMEKHAGVAPPVDRGDEAYDFPFKFYTELTENKQASKFMTEVLGYQFYEKLCEISEQYSRLDKSEPINNCDFYGNKKAGDALKKMMKLGSSKPMREVLETMFPEDPSVSAESLIEYYAPMKSWLVKMNSEQNVRTGWLHSDKKVSIITYNEEEDEVEE
ncbi:angiotensin-converting enzyme-like [Episyrphus balteatus]|uniref:angiotensin-converting enzyme-like n=1 Tax=Episyrphus balteatus TaxID=286459 RepID=UPI002486A879|nr:angiotensin-converting enzyme-like [Episyrphus balteatus]